MCQPEAGDNLTTKDVCYIRNVVLRQKVKHVSKLPTSMEEVHKFLNLCVVITVQNEDFIMINDARMNVIVFATPANVEFMCKNDEIYVDGTFDYCTKFLRSSLPSMQKGNILTCRSFFVFCVTTVKKPMPACSKAFKTDVHN